MDVSQYICLQYWACSQQCVSGTIGAALHCQLYHSLLKVCLEVPPSSNSLATSGGQSRPAMLNASTASRPTEHMTACAHTLIVCFCTYTNVFLLSLVRRKSFWNLGPDDAASPEQLLPPDKEIWLESRDDIVWGRKCSESFFFCALFTEQTSHPGQWPSSSPQHISLGGTRENRCTFIK